MIRYATICLAFVVLATTVRAAVWYVDVDNCPGPGSGSAGDPFCSIQDALSVAVSGDEIRVATGTYYPSQRYEPETPRTETFQLINGVTLLGGYAGLANLANPNDRNLLLYETIISGDLGLEGDDSDNCFHVFYHTEDLLLDATAVLDGFTITGGKADGVDLHVAGGGMFNYASSPTVRNCTFRGNWGIGGGGIANLFSDPSVVNCTFSRNSANSVDSRIAQGGAVYNAASSPTLENCTFHANLASGTDSLGGGMVNASDSAPIVTNCRFIGNEADLGGGVFNWVDCNPTMVNCVFSGNSALSGGGIFNGAASPTVTNCTFSGNTAVDDGGAMYNAAGSPSETSDPVITNCIMWGNTALSGPQIFSESGSSPTITYSCIQDGWSGAGNIGGLPEHNPLYADADGQDDVPGTEDDDLHVLPGSPCINTGSNAVPNLPETDLDGHVRVLCDTVDMGAYEFGIGDYQCDEDVDLDDFATWEACMTGPNSGPYLEGCEVFDFEYDGDVDLADVAQFQVTFEGQP